MTADAKVGDNPDYRPNYSASTPRKCRSYYGTESEFGKVDTPGMDLIQNAKIQIDRKGISHFRMRRNYELVLCIHILYAIGGCGEP